MGCPISPQCGSLVAPSRTIMQATVRGLVGPLDTRLFIICAIITIFTIILLCLLLSFLGCLFLVSLLIITVYLTSDLAQR